jgi:hypothetical protein
MTIADQLEALARAEFPDLNTAEVKVVRAATTTRQALCGPQADVADLSNNPEYSETGDTATGVAAWGIDREVRADVIRWLCIQEEAKKWIDPHGIQLLGARVTGELDLRHATVSFPVSMVHCRVGPVFLNDCQIPRLDLDGSCTGSIDGDGVHVKQSVYLRRVQVSGKLSLNLAQIGGTLTCEEGRILGEGGIAIWADGIKVGGDVMLRAGSTPFQSTGTVRLVGAEIHGDLDCSGGQFRKGKSGGQFRKGNGDALLLERATIHGELFFTEGFKVEGRVTLSNTSVTAMADDDTCWPKSGQLRLDGFTYTSLEPNDVNSRLQWLGLDASGATQPYRQLAKILQDSGNAKSARRVLIAMERKLSSKEWTRWLKALIGYGYEPVNAVWLLLALWLLGAVLCSQSYKARMIVPVDKDVYVMFKAGNVPPAYVPEFQPVIFSLENTFPVIKLGQVERWQADSQSAIRWFIWVQILLGWLFATLFVAAVSGIVQQG